MDGLQQSSQGLESVHPFGLAAAVAAVGRKCVGSPSVALGVAAVGIVVGEEPSGPGGTSLGLMNSLSGRPAAVAAEDLKRLHRRFAGGKMSSVAAGVASAVAAGKLVYLAVSAAAVLAAASDFGVGFGEGAGQTDRTKGTPVAAAVVRVAT